MTVTTDTQAPWSQLRLRQSAHLRDLLAETTFSVAQLIQPLFVVEGLSGSEPIPGLGENRRMGDAALLERVARDLDAGVRHFLLFGVPASKRLHELRFDHVRRVVSAIKSQFGDALHLWADICLCASTEHGHCAILDDEGHIDLGRSLEALAAMALEVADAGVDGVSPSDMMDGRTAYLRAALDEAGHRHLPIMSYSTKFASKFYGPFREAAGSAPQFGDRRHYQIDVRSRRDAIASSVRCANEGADLLMVKPGLTSLDLILPIAQATGRAVGAYQVSGEYAGLVALAGQGLIDLNAALLETWHVFRRAGAAYIITYGARDARAIGLGA
ncbi:MAG: porphobilinogen synthase [Vicinamibacterales bacterium]